MTRPLPDRRPLGRRTASLDETVETALLDGEGVIVSVNRAWTEFCQDNGGDPELTGVGCSYLVACERADGDPAAADVAAAIRTAMAGELPAPRTVRIACDAPDNPRYFDVLISSRVDATGVCVGAAVSLSRSDIDPTAAAGIAAATGQAQQPNSGSGEPKPREPDGADAGVGWASSPDLTFPDLPKMQLEELIGQLTSQAQQVLDTQGRLRSLLKANAIIASDLSLPVALQHIVTTARELVSARYAALGVIGPDGMLEQFVHVGMDPDSVEQIGRLPRGRGILGSLISQPRPLRLAELSTNMDSVGFPAGHPPMNSFLGVPIRIADEVFGNLYLTEKVNGGQFTEEDEQLTVALAATAAVAVANARLYAESEKRRRWLAASGELAPRTLSESGPPLDLIVAEAVVAADVDFAAIVLPLGESQVIVGSVAGALATGLAGRTAPLVGSLAGRVITTGKSMLVSEYHTADDAIVLDAEIGPLVLVPLAAGERVRGALTLGRLTGRPALTKSDMQMAESFANQAAVALELLDARTDQLALAQFEDRERIARDLHDHVIQELFAAGISMQGLAGAVAKPEHADRILSHADTLDRVITKIRDSIFRLQHQPAGPPLGLHTRLLEVVDEHLAQLGFSPQIQFPHFANVEVDGSLSDDIVAVAREALSNCARHANATSATVSLTAAGKVVVLEVTDNGDGIGNPTRSSGLANLKARAERNGGTLQLTTPDGGGTRLTWTATTA